MSVANVLTRSKSEPENWRYTNVEKILGSSYPTTKPHPSFPNNDKKIEVGAQFVFVDGAWQEDQSRFGDLPSGILEGNAKKGYRLVLEGQTCLVTQPVELFFRTTDAASAELSTKLQIELGASGRLTLIERHEAKQSHAAAQIMETEIILHKQAKLVHGKVVKGSANYAHLALTKVKVAEGAYYDNFALLKGGKLARNEIEVTLQGKLSQCALNGAMLLRGHEHADTTTRIIHAAPHGSSRQVYKTVLSDQARGVFQGKIIVKEHAQKTDGYQMSRALLLSDQAEMNAKPELEIYADDVKCSHGSTVGDLDADALFYLRARGLNEDEARGLLIRAFVDEIVDEIRVPEWRDFCRAEVDGWLDEQT